MIWRYYDFGDFFPQNLEKLPKFSPKKFPKNPSPPPFFGLKKITNKNTHTDLFMYTLLKFTCWDDPSFRGGAGNAESSTPSSREINKQNLKNSRLKLFRRFAKWEPPRVKRNHYVYPLQSVHFILPTMLTRLLVTWNNSRCHLVGSVYRSH